MNLATKMVLIGNVASDHATGGSSGLPAGVIATSYSDGRTVYHLGMLFDGVDPYHVGAYTVGSDSVPAHYWNSRWTHRDNPITIVRTPAQLVAANRMFPFGDTGCNVGAQGSRTPYTIMGSSDITKYMPTTGERPDIGCVTDNSAWYMLGGSPLPMLDWAQANDTCPIHFRDETTGKPISLITYPQANSADLPGLQGSPWLPKGPHLPAPEQGYTGFGGGWGPQQAHFCEMSYVAHMATRDLGFFENVQYNANFTVLCDASNSSPSGAILVGELRGMAWALRNLFMAHIATVDVEGRGELPATCHPSSYFKTLLDNALAHYSPIMTDPKEQTFRLFNGGPVFGPWQVDYMLTALAFGVLTGHSDWTPFYLWALGNVIARTNNTSGYPPGLGTAYYMPTVLGGQDPSLPRLTWAQSVNALVGATDGISAAQYAVLTVDPLNGGNAQQGNAYMCTTRAALVMADYLDKKGLAAVRIAYRDFDTCLTNAQTMFQNYGGENPRVAVVSP